MNNSKTDAPPLLEDLPLDTLHDVEGGCYLIELHDVPYLGDVYLIPWW